MEHNKQITKTETIPEIQANYFKIQVIRIVKPVCTTFSVTRNTAKQISRAYLWI